MDAESLADLLKPSSLNWAEDVEDAFGALNSVPEPNTHPITRAIAQAIAEHEGNNATSIFLCRQISMFEPSLPPIEEEGDYAFSQTSSSHSLVNVFVKTDNSESFFRSPGKPRRTTSIRALRVDASRTDTIPARKGSNSSMTQLSTNRVSPLSSFTTSDPETSYKHADVSQLLIRRKRDKWRNIVKKVWRKIENLRGGSWNYVRQSGWLDLSHVPLA
ncbi:hypothetical protein N7517_010979 [Penicillium concentricum]|uniref:Uncharacterized protein n=1 Tax=Penicillium concentricum TaxID=293559 RepID=A0A9W9RB96_9EURO|nr:uncharacterized protein N7517_010979 [Penicillium concentricum]KAJ5356370.1 hypothetical protein N7517_010979 [Penicillium concentricum]